MTTPIQTQCPHCQACFKVQQTQLNKVNATIGCDQCHQTFLVNKHLIVVPNTASTPSTQVKTSTSQANATSAPSDHAAPLSKNNNKKPSDSDNPKPSHNKSPSSDILIHDGLIYDDMDIDIDEPPETAPEYDSLDSMDAWLTQVSHTKPTTAAAKIPQSIPTSNIDRSKDLPASPPPPDAPVESSPIAKETLSSTAANNIHANVDNNTDNSWLEKLLEEQSNNEDIPPDDTDLSQLLMDMGVPIRTGESASEEHAKKPQAQLASMPTAHSIASLLWLLGCLVLALLLAAQYVMFNLDTLVKNPSHAQRLQSICSIAGCSLPHADLTALTVTNTRHNSSQIKTTGAFSDISATLNNKGPDAQLYPHIKVSVYGANDLIGEFIAAPSDYLLGKQSQLTADNNRQVLFTIPVANAQIREVTITPLY